MSSEHWKDWVIEQRQEYSQRKKSARLIRESESSSLGWSTPIVGDAHLASNPEAAQKRLAEGKSTLSRQVEAKSWPTATVFDTTGGSYPTEMVDGVYRSKHSQEPNSPWYGAKLKDAVETHEQNWATPIANDAKGSDYAGTKENPKALYLGGQVKNWPTATTRDWKDTNATVPPSRANPSKQTLGQRVAHVGLQDQANPNTNGKSQESWPTPRANKVHPEITEKNREHLANRKKANLEEDIAGHCGKATGKLNPNWVEHLMGLPAGWTDLGYWETE
jgi:hypothetical protein